MDIKDLAALAAANAKLPDNAFFAYDNVETIEFDCNLSGQIELTSGVTLKGRSIKKRRYLCASMRNDNLKFLLLPGLCQALARHKPLIFSKEL